MGNLRKWKEREAVAIAIAVAACITSSYQSSSYLSNSCSCSPKITTLKKPLLPQCSSPNNTLFFGGVVNEIIPGYFANTLSVRGVWNVVGS